MTNDVVLAEVVRRWIRQELPGDFGAADRGAMIARVAYAEGASVTEACERAQEFVESWSRHPAHRHRYRPLATVRTLLAC
ncbi:MAG TPA: hypothetical protein VHB02_12560 [Acidimicrobiales bacterium]|nr:hypothetical protein [Acidimicrobiales bacterium]